MVFDFAVLASLLHSLTSALPSPLTFLGAVVYLLLSLLLIFAGRRVIKFLVFLIAGLAVGAAGALLGTFLPLSVIAIPVGFVLGFIVGGLLGLLLLRFGIGVAVGLFAYYASLSLTHSEPISIIVGLVLFAIGLVLARSILGVATAIIGGVLFYDISVIYFHAPPLIAGLASIILAAVGAWVQWPKRHVSHSSKVGVYSGSNYSASKSCPKCGASALPGAEYCANCGAHL